MRSGVSGMRCLLYFAPSPNVEERSAIVNGLKLRPVDMNWFCLQRRMSAHHHANCFSLGIGEVKCLRQLPTYREINIKHERGAWRIPTVYPNRMYGPPSNVLLTGVSVRKIIEFFNVQVSPQLPLSSFSAPRTNSLVDPHSFLVNKTRAPVTITNTTVEMEVRASQTRFQGDSS